ncbi:MAG: helix-turn-helix transcriptional regulator [Clostridiales bacterium]|nr:helix-turn-helix transcriptional regulator [Clostridiales bacterium]
MRISLFYREKLKYYRKKLSLTQAQLAEKICVSEHYVRLIENGYNIPSVDLFVEICKVLDVPAYNLLQSNNEAVRFTKSKLYKKLKFMDENQLNSILDIIFR